MTLPKSESHEAVAASRVLQRLGSQTCDLIKGHMRDYYHIRLEEDSKTPLDLVRLHDALFELMGYGAEIIMQDIFIEMQWLERNNKE